MIQKIPASERNFNDFGSMSTYWLFSFSDYYDPNNMNFGPLRVFNDDTIQQGAGFPDHPHKTMEIVTIVLDGTLTHKDSLGNAADITTGEVQRMSAGNGIVHSEFNENPKPVHLYQLWFTPNKQTVAGYEQNRIVPSDSPITVLASNTQGGLKLAADATVMQLALNDQSYGIEIQSGNGCFVYVTNGVLKINGDSYESGDQARISNESTITFSTEEGVKAIVIEVTL